MKATELKDMLKGSAPWPKVMDKVLDFVKTMNEVGGDYGFKPPYAYQKDAYLRRLRYFLAQVAHESCGLIYTKELASGAEYDTGRKARMLGNTPEKDGDGQRYKGRGYIQITGRANYEALAKDLRIDCVNHPEMLEQPHWALMSALWFWRKKALNRYADKDAFTELTKRINGGTNGLQDRLGWLSKANKYINTL